MRHFAVSAFCAALLFGGLGPALAGSYNANSTILPLTFAGAAAAAATVYGKTPGTWDAFAYEGYLGRKSGLEPRAPETKSIPHDFATDSVSRVEIAVPEPASAAVLIVGMTVIIVIRQRRRRTRRPGSRLNQ